MGKAKMKRPLSIKRRKQIRRRTPQYVATTASGATVEPPPFMAGADRSSAPLPLINETAAPGGLSVSATTSTDPQSALNKHDPAVARIERRLSESTGEWRDVARALSAAVRDQISELQRRKPNEEDQLPDFNDLIAFLETLEKKLAALADALDQATKEAGVEPMFLGKAAVIARQLDLGLMGFLEKHRVRIFETGALITVGYLCGGLSGDAVEVLKMILGSRTP
jgi:chromosome segregation ATPase